jgi:hypothetical protein
MKPLRALLVWSLMAVGGLCISLPAHAQEDYASDPFNPTIARDAWYQISKAEAAYNIPSGLLHAISLVETGQGIRGWMLPWPYTVGINGTGKRAFVSPAAAQQQLNAWRALGFTRFNLSINGTKGSNLKASEVTSRLATIQTPTAIVTLEGRNFARRFNNSAEALVFLNRLFAQGYINVDVGMMQINWRVHGKNFRSVAEALEPSANLRYAVNYLLQHRQTMDWWGSVGRYHSGTAIFANKYVKNVYGMYIRIHRANNNA